MLFGPSGCACRPAKGKCRAGGRREGGGGGGAMPPPPLPNDFKKMIIKRSEGGKDNNVNTAIFLASQI